jgi:hypothetical protein
MTVNDVSDVGAKVGGRMAKLAADAVVYAQQKLTDHKSGLAQKVLADFTNHISDEVQGMFGNVYRLLAEHPDTPAEMRPLFVELSTGTGQGIGWLGGSIAGTATSASLFDLINNYMAPVIHRLIGIAPNSLLTPDIAAQAEARGIQLAGSSNGYFLDYRGNGIDDERFDVLVKLARRRVSANQAQDLINRKLMNQSTAQAQLELDGYSSEDADRILNARQWIPSPQEVAAMMQRDIVTEIHGIDLGHLSGATETTMLQLSELAGEPLGPQSLAEAFRRGFIDRDRFNRGIVQGPLRKEWFDVLELLSISRMSTIDAADAVNQGHMSLDQAKAVATANGLDDNDFATLIEIAGAPPGVDFITEALNRGIIDEETFTGAFLESRIKNKYVQLFLQMRTRLIPQETVRLLYRNGVYPREKALQTLLWHGFTPDDANALLALENTRQDGGARELTRAQIVDLYEVRALPRDVAESMLTDLGYEAANAATLLDLADFKHLQTFVNSAINRVKSAYITGKIDRATAGAQLDSLLVPTDQQDELFAIWDIERTTITKTLTPAQIRQAVKKELISAREAIARLTAQGYASDDAELFLQLTA